MNHGDRIKKLQVRTLRREMEALIKDMTQSTPAEFESPEEAIESSRGTLTYNGRRDLDSLDQTLYWAFEHLPPSHK